MDVTKLEYDKSLSNAEIRGLRKGTPQQKPRKSWKKRLSGLCLCVQLGRRCRKSVDTISVTDDHCLMCDTFKDDDEDERCSVVSLNRSSRAESIDDHYNELVDVEPMMDRGDFCDVSMDTVENILPENIDDESRTSTPNSQRCEQNNKATETDETFVEKEEVLMTTLNLLPLPVETHFQRDSAENSTENISGGDNLVGGETFKMAAHAEITGVTNGLCLTEIRNIDCNDHYADEKETFKTLDDDSFKPDEE